MTVVSNQNIAESVERRQNEETDHKQNYMNLDAIFNSVHNGILSIDVEGKITAMNPAAERMAKTKKDEAIGKFLNEVVAPSGLLNVIRTGERHSEKYTVGNRKYLAHRSPIFEGKKLVGAVGVFQEIAEVEMISNELSTVRQLVDEIETIMNHSQSGICIVDSAGMIIRKNLEFDRIYFTTGFNRKQSEFRKIVYDIICSKQEYKITQKHPESKKKYTLSGYPILNEKGVVERVVLFVEEISSVDELKSKLVTMQRRLADKEQRDPLILYSDSMKILHSQMHQASQTEVTILIQGEQGTEQEKIASTIIEMGDRKNAPYLTIDCSILSEKELDQELFGYYERANERQNVVGCFEQADGGTIFLRNIDQMPMFVQVKLLRLLKSQSVEMENTLERKIVDVRLIVSTHKDLKKYVAQGKFNEDLYYMLHIVTFTMPPLRERKEDLSELLQQKWAELTKRYNKDLLIEKEALSRLVTYHWPGNERELFHVLEHLFISTSRKIHVEAVAALLGDEKPVYINKIMPLREAVEELEKELIQLASTKFKTSKEIANVLQVNPSTVFRKIKKLELE
ncbi:PAS domain-containing protein [Sporosarcina sp. PTS2304]|uniref:sigma 54-interacting transcriptional regulator n=1 Tax=Sporosarcina sp. PTS2304 TaxID=2283194 RepID=UPI000E0D0F54|nr:sigma 54-interacting transcriptional regulator [Sporosarcina sp. PTS2304]AXH99544.1 PAS domain-containing protein [Sporosarcina sp. PTS2304]